MPQDARYAIYVHYYPLKDTDKDILFSCMVDGKYPYSESTSFSLPRLWQDETGGSFEVDKQGNDMRPKQIEKPAWTTYAVQDVVGLYDEPYFISLTAGTHTLRFSMVREKMLLGNITLKNKEEVVSYNDYYALFSEKEHIAGKIVLQQAENSFEKNSSTLYTVYDRTTPAICIYTEKLGVSELMPLFCGLDEVMITLQHGILHRKQTLADGGEYCDYFITGNKE